jgi:hypothetical protein
VALIVATIQSAWSPAALAQTSIRVQSGEVLVPTAVYDTAHLRPVGGLTVKDFDVYQDGKKQMIRTVSMGRDLTTIFRDNLGMQEEDFSTPRGKWGVNGEPPEGWYYPVDFYLIGYTPALSPEGSCHRIKVKVRRRHVLVNSRSRYCNTEHTSSDPLDGTHFSKKMELYAVSHKPAKDVSLQASYVYTANGLARMDVRIDFPFGFIDCRNGPHIAGVLGLVYAQDGTIASRFSDDVECPAALLPLLRVRPDDRYEAQVDLAPGKYDVRAVISDGERFRLAEMPLTIDRYNRDNLAISGITLCKRFHKPTQVLPESALLGPYPAKAEPLPSFLVPLTSRGTEFTPAGDTRFVKKQPCIAYFEIYEPLLSNQPAMKVEVHLRIVDQKTGEVEKVFQPVNVARYEQAGSTTIHVAREIPLDKLARGSYRLEGQATDSTGRSTPWRTADFTTGER